MRVSGSRVAVGMAPVARFRVLLVAWAALAQACTSDTLSPAGGEDSGVPLTTSEDAAASVAPDAEQSPPPDAGTAAPVDAETQIVEDASAGAGDAQALDARTSAADAGTITSTTPLALPRYTMGQCPRLTFGATSSTSINVGFTSMGVTRQFRLLVPRSYDGARAWPLMFAWHWLNAQSGSFVRDGELESAAEQMGFIIALPDKKLKANGDKQYLFDWPFVETNHAEEELVFMEDMLACIANQFTIDRTRVYAIGVSAGGLWVTYMAMTPRVGYFAAVESLSGGLGDVAGVWHIDYHPQPNKFPAVVLWGGPTDWLGVNFERASMKLRDELIDDGHFVVTCTHMSGHAVPPIMAPPGGGTRFYSLWRFMLDHPFGTPPGFSPYQMSGLPSEFPDWCQIATP